MQTIDPEQIKEQLRQTIGQTVWLEARVTRGAITGKGEFTGKVIELLPRKCLDTAPCEHCSGCARVKGTYYDGITNERTHVPRPYHEDLLCIARITKVLRSEPA